MSQVSHANDPAGSPGQVAISFVVGKQRGSSVRLKGAILLGQDAANDVCLAEDALLDRFHILLAPSATGWRLRDLNSQAGTWVNGQRIVDEVTLRAGDYIRCGGTEFQFRVENAPPPASDFAHKPGPGIRPPVDLSTQASVEYQLFPGYTVLRPLGQGGMGVVYQARDSKNGRLVAIKAIRPDLVGNRRADRRFFREIAALLQLRHPRIVEFIEAGSTDETLFLVMEYLETVDITRELAVRSLKSRVRLATGLMVQVLDALDYAHNQGWLHRDLKPGNILIQAEEKKWRAKVSDFGLAKNLERAGFSCVTDEGQTLGSLPYMAPEQVGASRDVNYAADIFSAGATLYYWLTELSPREFLKSRDPLEVVAECQIIPLERRAPDLPPALCDFVNRALAKDPSDRFASSARMRTDLAQIRQELQG